MAGNSARLHRLRKHRRPAGYRLPFLAMSPGPAGQQKDRRPVLSRQRAKLQWIENASWEYRLSFDVTPAMLARSNVDLVFNGIDAAAQVSVNGVEVLAAYNMFRIWRVPVKGHLHAGKNLLYVVFPSPITAAAEIAALDPWQPKTKTEAKTYIRKAAYEYGWDWGPRFVTSGIWRPVRIEAWDKVRIADFAIRQRDVSREVAHVDAEVEIEAASAGSAKVSVQYTDNGKPVKLSAQRSTSMPGATSSIFLSRSASRSSGIPAGYGEQPLYEFTAQVGIGGQPAETRKVKAGLRSIVLRSRTWTNGAGPLNSWSTAFPSLPRARM